jgi:predicted NAD/FAD-dependent oxidoreductase
MTHDTIIIGAGISGLTAAGEISRAGLQCLLLEKSRGVGGRMCTRRFDGKRFDHGAQFFRARSKELLRAIAEWEGKGLVQPWPNSATSISKDLIRYCSPGGMSAIPKHIAESHTVHLNKKIVHLSEKRDHWIAMAEDGTHYKAKSIISSAPVPQLLELLEQSSITPESHILKQLEGIRYHKCIALLLSLDSPTKLKKPFLEMDDHSTSAIAWIADNVQKQVSGGIEALTIHCSNEFSEKYFDEKEESICEQVLESLGLQNPVAPNKIQVHRWRYASPTHRQNAYYLNLGTRIPAYACGDAFGGPKVEGAFLSGLEVGRQFAQIFKKPSE